MEYGSTLYVGMARGGNGRPFKCVQYYIINGIHYFVCIFSLELLEISMDQIMFMVMEGVHKGVDISKETVQDMDFPDIVWVTDMIKIVTTLELKME